ncbi:hypothetical protein GYMC10_4025 [Paenibacillus sp. Y412MC10]|nr:hypothetical protein GYMC10_4025 [Paenibacillus sp. Y412MC10]
MQRDRSCGSNGELVYHEAGGDFFFLYQVSITAGVWLITACCMAGRDCQDSDKDSLGYL